MDFDNYDLAPAIYDEMFLQDGSPREHCHSRCLQLYETLTEFTAEELASIQEDGSQLRSFSNEGITFTVYGDDEATTSGSYPSTAFPG